MNHIDVLHHLDRVLATGKTIDAATFQKPSERGLFLRRAEQLRALVKTKASAELTRADIATAVFPGLKADSVRTQFSRFRTLLEKIGSADGHAFALVQPEARNTDDSQIKCVFTGDSMEQFRLAAEGRDLESVSREGLEAQGAGDYIPLQAWPDEPRFFVSFAVAESKQVDAFMRELLANLPLRCRHKVRYWRFDEVTAESGIAPGEENEAEIRKAMSNCQFGLLLISPTYLGREFIKRVEMPYFLGPNAKAPAIPVAFRDFTPGQDKDARLDSVNVFALKGKAYNQVSSNQRAEFIKQLASRIESYIDRHRLAVESPLPISDRASADARKFAMSQLDEKTQQDLKEYCDLHGKVEAELGAGSMRKKARTNNSLEIDTPSREGAVDVISNLLNWANSGSETPAYMALLGETGAGKTMTCLEFTRRLLDDWKTDPLVIYLDLRRANEDGLLKRSERPLLEEIMTAVLRRTGSGQHAGVAELLKAVRTRKAVLIWDGLDEVLVHLGHEAGQAFFRQLLEALPPRFAGQPGAGRLLFSCRTQYFRDLNHEADLFTGGQKEGLPVDGSKPGYLSNPRPPRASFGVLRVLPFSEEQIRGYLIANVPGLDVDRAFEVISTVHNLRELAGQPYLLSLLRESLASCDEELAAGRTVRSIDLYERLVNRWLEREKGREFISRNHKRRLMNLLAAHFWEEGVRSIPVSDLDDWLEKMVVTDPYFSAGMGTQWSSGAEVRDIFCEHLRAATLLGRWDGDTFRFAHTSLLEYFLACHLADTLENQTPDAWTLPAPSSETLVFLAERWTQRREQNPSAARRMDATLISMLAESRDLRSQNALAFYLLLNSRGEAVPVPTNVSLKNLDLTAWKFHGSAERPLRLPVADFSGSTLIRASFEHVEFSGGSRWQGADLRSAEFNECGLEQADFCGEETKLDGGFLRACRMAGSRNTGASLMGIRVWSCVKVDHTIWPGHPPTKLPSVVPQIGSLGALWNVSFSPDGLHMLTASENGSLRIWDIVSGKCQRHFEHPYCAVFSAQYSNDGRIVVTGSADGMVRIWDANNGECLGELEGHSDFVTSVAISPDGRWILSGSEDETLRCWDMKTGNCINVIEGHIGPIHSVAISPKMDFMISGSSDGTLRIWEVTTGECLRVLRGQPGIVWSVAFSADGEKILSCSLDDSITIWNPRDGVRNLVIPLGPSGFGYNSAIFSKDAATIYSGNKEGDICLWNALSGQLSSLIKGTGNWIKSLAISPNNSLLLSGDYGHLIRILDTKRGQCLRELGGWTVALNSVAFTEGEMHILCRDEEGKLQCWTISGSRTSIPRNANKIVGRFDHHVELNGFALAIIGNSTIRLTQGNRLLRDIIPLPNEGTLVLEPWDETEATKPAHECRWKLASGPPDAWRYACIVDRADGSLHPLEF